MLELIDHGPVRELRLARPPVNALNAVLLAALDKEIARASDGSAGAPKAIVISGAPGMFSAGLDIREVTAGDAAVTALVTCFSRLQLRIVNSSVPIIAALSGQSPAGGAVIALLCDYRIMAAGDYRIGLNEVQVGLYPGETIFRVLERIVGTHRAAALLPRGAMLNAAEALAIGLVDEVVELSAVVTRAVALATELAALPPKVYARTRHMARAGLREIFESPPESLESLLADGWVTDETRERMAKFMSPR